MIQVLRSDLSFLDCTPKALQHKFQELKKFSAGAANGIVTAPATPGKRGRSNAVSTPKTPKTNGNKSPAKNIKSGNSKHTRDESELEAHESDADSEAGIKGFDDKDSSDDADQPAVDRSALRRSASSEPGRYEGLDKDTEDKHERAPKRVKKEIHA
jgi:hypothetical protein